MTLVPGLVPWMEASGHSQLLPKYTVSPCEAVWDQVWFAAPLQSQICVRPPRERPGAREACAPQRDPGGRRRPECDEFVGNGVGLPGTVGVPCLT